MKKEFRSGRTKSEKAYRANVIQDDVVKSQGAIMTNELNPNWKLDQLDKDICGIINSCEAEIDRGGLGIVKIRQMEKERNKKLVELINTRPSGASGGWEKEFDGKFTPIKMLMEEERAIRKELKSFIRQLLESGRR